MSDPNLTKAGTPRKRPARPGEGHPTLYQPRYCDEVVTFMAEGYSLTAFAGHLGVAPDTVYGWQETQPKFSEAVARAKAVALLAWERDGRHIAKGGGGPGAAPMVMFALKNMAPNEWRDTRTQEISFPDADKSSPQQIAAALLRSFSVIGRMADADDAAEPGSA